MFKKNKDIMPYIITICVFMLVLFLLIAGGVGYYSLYQGKPGLVALYLSLQDMMLLRFHASIYYGNYYTVAIVLYVILVLLFYIEQGRYAHDAGGIEAGSAKWNDNIKQFNRKYNEPFGDDKSHSFNNTILSKNVSLSMDDMETQLNNNVMVLGPAGSGKSRFVVKPNILQAMSGNCSMIISDPSGELYRSTSKQLEEKGVEIRVFNLLNMRFSGYYNPFRYVQDDAGVGILIDTLIENTTPGEQSGKGDPFWEKSEKALLSACIYYVKDFCAQEYQTFGTVLSIIRLEQLSENVAVNQESVLDKLFTGKVILKNGNVVELKNKDERAVMESKLRDSLAWKNYMVFKLGGVRTLKSILISAAVRLNPFNVPELENLTSRDTVDLYSLGDKRVALFLIIPQTSKTYNFLASILYTQTFEVLYQHATTKPGARLPVPVRLVLDEFVNTGKIPNFDAKISTCRKYNIGVIVIIQDIPQIKEMYKDNYETILANCDSTIVLGANDQTTAEYISKLLGKSTITSRSFNRKKGNPMSSGVNLQQTGRELMMPDELRAMDNRYCIVLIRAEKPFYDEKYDLSQHPNYIYTGDYDRENAVEITDNDSLYNFVDKTYQKIEESGKESKEAENEISQPVRLRTIKDMFSTIDDYERKDAVNYMLQTQNAIIKAAEICYKKKKKIMCMQAQVDINLVAPYLEMFNKKYKKSIIIFANTPPVGCLKGLFVDPSGMIQSDFRTAGYKFNICTDYESSPDNLQIFETERINADKFNDICLLLENDNIPLTDLL